MICPESDTCPESEGCSHKGEHARVFACGLGREFTKMTDCPKCLETNEASEALKAKLLARFQGKEKT